MLRGVPGVHRSSRVRVQADAAEGQLDGVGLADDHGAQLANRADEKALALPPGGQFPLGPGPDRKALDAVQILHRDGDPGQRARIVAARDGRVDRSRLCQGALGIEDDVCAEVAGLVTANRIFRELSGGVVAAANAGGRLLDGLSGHGVPDGEVTVIRAVSAVQYRRC